MQELTNQIKDFLQYIALEFIKFPEQAELRVAELDEGHLRFRLIVSKEDVAMLIGRNGFTISAIRNLARAIAMRHDIHLSLRITTHEEENMATSEAS